MTTSLWSISSREGHSSNLLFCLSSFIFFSTSISWTAYPSFSLNVFFLQVLFSQTVTSFAYGFVTNLAQMRRDTVPNKFTPVYSLLFIFFYRSKICFVHSPLFFFLETRWLCDKRETIRSLALMGSGRVFGRPQSS